MRRYEVRGSRFSHTGLSHFGTPPTRAKHCIDNAGFVPTFISHNTYAEHGKDGGGDRCAGGGPLSSLLCKPGGRKKLQTVLCSSSEWSLSETLVTAPLLGSYNVTSTSSLLSRFIPVAGTLKVSGLCSPKVFSTPFRRFAHSSPDVKSMSLHLNNQSTLAAMTMITVT